MTREADRLRDIDALFEAALELDGDDRARLLEGLAADLRLEVERLLAYSAAGDVADQIAGGTREQWSALTRLDAATAARGGLAGEIAGPFRLVREIGRGGMSVVYLAQRTEGGFEQRVAVKVVAGPFADRLLERRLLQERRILAGLEHPNVARILDGGRTKPHGWVYLAMEFVEGAPIDEHCAAEQLDLDARLGLFLQVADAVQAAHRQLIVHRDLKPSNILVDRSGVVKLLDFGIAKVLEESAAKATVSAERFLTLDYASPEQVVGERASTASDVYQLGVVLYELLAGQRPYDLGGRSFAEVQRLVAEVDPLPPSRQRTSRGVAAIPSEVDDIVLCALRKEPGRRYLSVAELGADIQRWQRGEPVVARAPTRRYIARKFVERHRWMLAGAAGVVLALTLGLVGTAWQAREARSARDLAQGEARRLLAAQRFLVEIFQDADPARKGSLDRTVGTVLERATQRIESTLADQPDLQLALLTNLGGIYHDLTAFDRAVPLLEDALELAERLHGRGSPAAVSATHQLASALRESRQATRAVELDEQALQALETRGGSTSELATAWAHLGLSRLKANQLDDAAAALTTAERLGDGLPQDHATRYMVQTAFAVLEQTRGNFEKAFVHHQAAAAVARLRAAEEPLLLTRSLHNMGVGLSGLKRYAEAEAVLEEALTAADRAFPAKSAWHAMNYNSLALVRSELGRHAEAEAAIRSAVEMYTSTVGPDDSRTLLARLNLGYCLYRGDDFEAAIGELGDLLVTERLRGSADSVRAGMANLWYGRALIDAGRPELALGPLATTERVLGDFYGSEDSLVEDARLEQAVALFALGRDLEARAYLPGPEVVAGGRSQESAARAAAASDAARRK